MTSEFLQQFCERIRKATEKPVSLTAEYSTGHKERYSDENEFLGSPWLLAHTVNSIVIDSGAYGDTCVQLRFSDFLFRRVALQISGQRERCILLEREILALTSSIKTYIAPLHSQRYCGHVGGAVIAVFGLAAYEHTQDALASVLITLGFIFIAINLIGYLLPKYEIQIGRGKRAAARRRFLAISIFGFFVVGALGAIYQDAVVDRFSSFISLK
ncbi:hypothetical protein RMR21_011000 [Agrobacterium sp. rho-8.1]|nr:hypothetical protein [Agrobacterium sp. rho-8.1]